MKKVFKKAISMGLALAMMVGLMSALTVQAAAAGPEISNKEIKTVSGYTNIALTPQEGDNGVDKFALSFKGAANTQYVVFLLNGNEIYPTLPDKDNIRYIDQRASAADGTVSFNVYPDKLPSGKYAVYVSSTKCECLATFDVKSTAPEVINKTLNEEATYSISGATLNVEYKSACAILVEHADGTYTRLTAKANTSGGYDFDISGVDSSEKIVIVLKGDINGDGRLRGNEVTQIKSVQLQKATFDSFQFAVADVDGNGTLRGNEVTQIKSAQLNKGTLNW